MTTAQTAIHAALLLSEFNDALGVTFVAPSDLLAQTQAAIEGCKPFRMLGKKERTRCLIALVNSKLNLNKARLQEFLDSAAAHRVFLNYHDKAELAECLDYCDKTRLGAWLRSSGYDADLLSFFNPITKAASLEGLKHLLSTGAVNRSDAKKCDLSERQDAILRSLFGSYVFHSFPVEAMHAHLNPDCRSDYESDYYSHLLKFHPTALSRKCALIYLVIDEATVGALSAEALRDTLCSFIRSSYERLANHCFLAIQIKPFREGTEDGQWKLYSDLVLYAEKHREKKLETGYFRPSVVEQATTEHIPELSRDTAKFDLANEGFFFRDCFILSKTIPTDGPRAATTSDAVDLLLLFDKNERDEQIIPCPACRSFEVRGNSYPALGVRSWECQNSICPDRSAYDRGNRYSLSAIIKQEAIKSDADQIPERSLKRWKLDVLFDIQSDAVPDMLIRHFSLHGDALLFVDGKSGSEQKHGRQILHEQLDPCETIAGLFDEFQSSAFFNRFILDKKPARKMAASALQHKVGDASIYHGDCFAVLSQMKPSSIDAAVTSPPYYNARSYSTWPNIYCYLYDMYNSARQVFRTLKPGGLYVFNIFDYFDNENNIALSAMGKKRMILGPYVINMFRRAGFDLVGNTAWYKGEIEGKRNFNQGNRSPYYQYPFNCWEHCFIFQKPVPRMAHHTFPTILDAKPVMKMVRGQNILGHTAPFPFAIPQLLISQMKRGECVLDPYGGSMTTARVANEYGVRSISIEIHKEYCDLGIRLLEQQWSAEGDLFNIAS